MDKGENKENKEEKEIEVLNCNSIELVLVGLFIGSVISIFTGAMMSTLTTLILICTYSSLTGRRLESNFYIFSLVYKNLIKEKGERSENTDEKDNSSYFYNIIKNIHR